MVISSYICSSHPKIHTPTGTEDILSSVACGCIFKGVRAFKKRRTFFLIPILQRAFNSLVSVFLF
nr:MAG TPA: hypothetical protein [Caudoviricetes sp.]